MLRRIHGVGLLALLLASPAAAQDVFDIIVQQDSSGRLVTGAPNFGDVNGAPGVSSRVFAFEFGDTVELANPFQVRNPGFNVFSNSSPALPAGTSAILPNTGLAFDLLPATIDGLASNLFYWDGLDSNDPGASITAEDVSFGFGAEVQDHELSIITIGGNRTTATGVDEIAVGSTIDVTSAAGALHRHPIYELATSAGDDPEEGVYLLTLQARQDGLETSDPFFLLFGTPTLPIASLTAAEAYVSANIDSLVPDTLPGDFNLDGFVDAADFVSLRGGLGSGDDAADLALFVDNFGAGEPPVGALLGPGLLSAVAIPEPGAGALVLSALGGLAAARRRYGRAA